MYDLKGKEMQGVTEDEEHKPKLLNDEEKHMKHLSTKFEESVMIQSNSESLVHTKRDKDVSVCSFPKCKFVHATVFEKEHFFRTGYLPPHTLSHLAEPSVLQPPPPPPQSEEMAVDQSSVYLNGPLPQSSISSVENAVQYNAENGVERSEPNIFNAVQVTSTATSPKLHCSEIDDDASSSPHHFDFGELLPRKCKNCLRTEIREQLLKNKVEKHIRLKKKLSQKIARLDKKNAVIAAALRAFLKSDVTVIKYKFNSKL